MNKDQIIGNWHEIKGEAKRQWGKLTDDDLTQIAGDSEKLAGTIQKNYGIAKEEAEQQVKNWHKECAAKNKAA